MPNYGIVVTPEFRPMSYEQYAKPFEDYAKVYNAMADAYDTLETEANQWEKLANSEIDAPQYAQYKRYADDLRAAADDLATNGLNTKTRGALSNLRKRYAGEIKPIADAYTLREEERKAQRDARMKNPYIRFNRDASSTGLGAYMAGTPGYESIDLAQIKANVMTDVKPLAQELHDLKTGKLTDSLQWRKILGDQYFEARQREGYTSQQIADFIQQAIENPDSQLGRGILGRIAESAIDASGVSSWDYYNDENNSLRNEVLQSALSGLWQAIGTTKFEHLTNRGWKDPGDDEIPPYNPVNPVAIYTHRQKSEDEKAINDFESKGYIDAKGNLTEKALNRILKPVANPTPVTTGGAGGPSRTTTEQNYTDSDLFNTVYRWAQKDEPGLTKEQFKKAVKAKPNYVVALYEKMKTDNPFAKYDANQAYEYNYHLDPSEQSNFKNLVRGDLYEVDFDEESNQWKDTGKTLSHSDFGSNDYTPTDLNFGMYGNTVLVNTPDGTKEYRMPTNINPVAETSRDRAVQAAYVYGLALNKGKALRYDKVNHRYVLSNRNLTIEELIEYQNEKARWESQAYEHTSKIGFTNKSKPVEHKP